MSTHETSAEDHHAKEQPFEWRSGTGLVILAMVAALPSLVYLLMQPKHDDSSSLAALQSFHMKTWGPFGGWFEVQYTAPNDVVVYTKESDGKGNVREVPVTEHDLIQFVNGLNRAHFDAWRPHYANEGVMDADAWSLRVTIAGQTYASAGEGNHPPGYGDVLDALRNLLGVSSL